MGKWSHLIGEYPEKREASLAEKAKFIDKDIHELESLAAEIYDKKKRLEREFNKAKTEYTAVSEVLLDKWKEKQTTGCRRDDIGMLSRSDEVYARIANMREFKEWAAANGLANMVQETVNAQSLSSTVKQLMLDGEEIPEGISVFTKSKVKVTKPKTKGESNG